jgi:hypothetical protein
MKVNFPFSENTENEKKSHHFVEEQQTNAPQAGWFHKVSICRFYEKTLISVFPVLLW